MQAPRAVESDTLRQRLDVALAPNLSYCVEATEGRYWFVRGAEEKHALVTRGCPPGRVWTIRELESLLSGPLTIERCLRSFQSPAPAEPG